MTRKNSSFYADAYRSGTQSVSMQVFTANAEKIQLNVYDISGQLVKAESWALNAGSNNKVIELRNGTYVLEWKKADGTSLTQKIVIQ